MLQKINHIRGSVIILELIGNFNKFSSQKKRKQRKTKFCGPILVYSP